MNAINKNQLSDRAKFWLEHIRKYIKDGRSVAEYTKQNSLTEKSFQRWKSAFAKAGIINSAKQNNVFQKVDIETSNDIYTIKVFFPNGIHVEWSGSVPDQKINSFLSRWM